jgi:plasmid stabilization system protein ParE
VIRPKADEDLEEQAYYYAVRGSPELGHHFLVAAHETSAQLSKQPAMGWSARLQVPRLKALRVFPVNGFKRIMVLYRAVRDYVDILRRVVHGSRNLQSLLRREGLGQ